MDNNFWLWTIFFAFMAYVFCKIMNTCIHNNRDKDIVYINIKTVPVETYNTTVN